MKISQLIETNNHSTRIMITETRTYKLWESAGRKLVEAELTADQIKQLFQQIEQGSTAAGTNRTMLGKGVDAASAVNKAWEDLKTKIQNSGPIKNVDAMYDQAAEKLKQATGGDQGVMKYVQKYRDFAKKHPVAQSLIYSALIAAAGISGAGLGGAAALGLFKLTDKLLQGEKFSSAAYSGAKTGAMAYGASKIGDFVKGQMAPDEVAQRAQNLPNKIPRDAVTSVDATSGVSAAQDVAGGGIKAARDAAVQSSIKAGQEAIAKGEITNLSQLERWMSDHILSSGIDKQFQGTNIIQGIEGRVRNTLMQQLSGGDGTFVGGQLVKESLSKHQILEAFTLVSLISAQLNEGVWDTIKGKAASAAGAVASKAQQIGKGLTTKVTADKLMKAWQKAGSPTDSDEVAKIIKSAGVADNVVNTVFTSMKIPITLEPVTTTTAPSGGLPSISAAPTGTEPNGTAPRQGVDSIVVSIQNLLSKLKQIDPTLYPEHIKKITGGA